MSETKGNRLKTKDLTAFVGTAGETGVMVA